VRVVTVDSERASPFATSLVFDWVAEYMYEGRPARSPSAAPRGWPWTASCSPSCSAPRSCASSSTPVAVASLELDLQVADRDSAAARRRPPPPTCSAASVDHRRRSRPSREGVDPAWLGALAGERRAVAVRIAGETRWIAAEEAGRYRDALGVALPTGLADAHLEGGGDPLGDLLRRHARTHVPFSAAEPARRWGLGVPAVEAALRRLAGTDGLLRGAFVATAGSSEWCHPEVLTQPAPAFAGALRRQVEPGAVETLGGFLPAWQGVNSGRRGWSSCSRVVGMLQGAVVPASTLERDVLGSRVRDYQPRLLDELISLGEVVWVGARGAGQR